MASSDPSTPTTTVHATKVRRVAIAGNPNAGKSTVFNLLTGLKQKVGNYSGVTVERKSGTLVGHEDIEIIDLPGTYSLNPKSEDEQIAYDAITSHLPDEDPLDLIVCVVNATNLERNLYLASQILDLGLPTIIVLNMMDEVEAGGTVLDIRLLSDILGAPIVPMVATRKQGLEDLRNLVKGSLPSPGATRWRLDEEVGTAILGLADELKKIDGSLTQKRREAECLRILNSDRLLDYWETRSPSFFKSVKDAREELDSKSVAYGQAEVRGRYSWLGQVARRVTKTQEAAEARKLTDRLDSVLLHRIWGPVIFVVLLLLVFQAIFSWATPFMDLIDAGISLLAGVVRTVLPEGMLADLLVDGVIAGVGNVVIFLPQILFLFFFLSLMESTGYMARSAFIMDRVMRRVGLSGGSVMPMMSAFACAVPAIMATRTMKSQRDRLLTILVIPLMSCSARLPVYTLFIGAFIPAATFFGPIGYQGLTMFSLYIFGTVVAFVAAAVLKKTISGPESFFMLELPPYRAPQWKLVFWRMVERAKIFLIRAGRIIFVFSILLWFGATYPKAELPTEIQSRYTAVETELASLSDGNDDARVAQLEDELLELDNTASAYQMEQSAIGYLGKMIEPVMSPLGFDWKLSAGIITAFAAREVIVGALGTIYSIADADEESLALREHLQNAKDPETGRNLYTPLVALSLLVFFVLALQCTSTLAIAKRELNSWKWPVIMWVYMTGLAYLASLIVYQGGLALGWG
ncbi:MAG: ferrous iron transport protein B [Rhodothermaceae bacterium]|nr:ferrous iron transport protein B [Rhodothermaceae bacterium]